MKAIQFNNEHPQLGERKFRLECHEDRNHVGIVASHAMLSIELSNSQMSELMAFLIEWSEENAR